MRKWVLLITFFSTLNMLFANDESTGSPFSQSKFVPDISLILDSTYAHANRTNEELAYLYRPGFTLIPADEARHGHTETHIENGFTVNYAEIAFYSVVDPYFDLFAVCEFDESNASIEEAYFTTRALPFGFQIKGGKFLSGFGRINEQHAHYWNFVDMPLVNNAFFGESGLREVGVRINWVAPTPFFFSIAFEILRGENPRSFGVEKIFHISGPPFAERQTRPNLYTGNIRTSFDIGNILILGGASAAGGNSQINHGIDRTGQMGSAFLGTTYLFGGDITVKYIFDSQRSIAFQAEYLHRTMKGDNYLNDALSALTAMRTHKK
ncbi:MAG: hypothetical protein N2316_10180, partial [Spirochaetes bacterium]|nr:hypothetical protein [Spirochaetota bacterium]